jgi:hypothetical protein
VRALISWEPCLLNESSSVMRSSSRTPAGQVCACSAGGNRGMRQSESVHGLILHKSPFCCCVWKRSNRITRPRRGYLADKEMFFDGPISRRLQVHMAGNLHQTLSIHTVCNIFYILCQLPSLILSKQSGHSRPFYPFDCPEPRISHDLTEKSLCLAGNNSYMVF